MPVFYLTFLIFDCTISKNLFMKTFLSLVYILVSIVLFASCGKQKAVKEPPPISAIALKPMMATDSATFEMVTSFLLEKGKVRPTRDSTGEYTYIVPVSLSKKFLFAINGKKPVERILILRPDGNNLLFVGQITNDSLFSTYDDEYSGLIPEAFKRLARYASHSQQ